MPIDVVPPSSRSAAALALHWACLSNLAQPNAFAARLTLTNRSGRAIGAGWTLYFNSCRKTIAGSVQGGFTIEHLNGDLFRLRSAATADWLPGVTLTVDYQAQFWAISITDAPLGFYLVCADGAVCDLGDPQIAPFTTPAQRQRGALDQAPAADAAGRHRANADVHLLAPAQLGRITPTPCSAHFDGAHATLTRHASIVFSTGLASEAALLRAMLDALPASAETGAISRIVLDTGPVDIQATASADEAYRLDISGDAIHIRGAGAHGVFNGIQSLLQLIDGASVARGTVVDAPRFAYRGLMLDVARHFADRQTVLRLLDCMALYKLNRFHFHLTDDEGWRFEVPALPELTAIGARRGVAADGVDGVEGVEGLDGACLPPSFGSGAAVDGSAGSGYYSDDDFIAIVRHAQQRHIEVIPEFNLPGHARAAIVAMRARHERLRAAGDVEGAERYLLDDLDDRSVYESVQLWHDNVVCIARPSVERFFETVVSRLVALFGAAGVPLRTIHTGGDEVPAGAWLGSPLCRALMAQRGWTTLAQLRSDFIGRCHAILARHGIAYAGWEETALEHRDGAPTPNLRFAQAGLQVYAWNNAWGWGREDLAYRLANAGYQVVLANAANLYFDLAHAKDGAEPGYYWAGFVDTRDTFIFCPLDAGATAGVEPMGAPVAAATINAMEALSAAGRRRIAGLQGQLWGENANSRQRIEYLAAPRLIALAERAWAPDPGWQTLAAAARAHAVAAAWNEFANRLGQRVLPQLDRLLGFGYRLPPPGVQTIVQTDGRVLIDANLALPGLALHYTVDGSMPTAASHRYTVPLVPPPGAVVFRISCFDSGGRASRVVSIDLATDLTTDLKAAADE
ncbi:family 20 glycosylhydrolase [Massilia sp. PWRC2]|uniref:family 20 glycosylhydrolase n=1 Tax=Massilia sp. PWRC2 TaxID=2804626 RepID=UPI003CF78B12